MASPPTPASVARRWASTKYGAAPAASSVELSTRPRSMASRARAWRADVSSPDASISSRIRAAPGKSPARPVARACWVRSTADDSGSRSSSAARLKLSAVAAGSAKSQVSRMRCSSSRASVIDGFAPQARLVDREPFGLLTLEGRTDETREERVRPSGPRPELGVGLGGDVVRVHVAGQLHELDQVEVGVGAGEHDAGRLELLAVVVVDLVAVAVPLLDTPRAVGRADDRPGGEVGGVQTQPHRAAEVAGAVDDVLLLLHRRDDGLGAVGVELGGRGLLEAGDVAVVLDDHALQAQAQAQG